MVPSLGQVRKITRLQNALGPGLKQPLFFRRYIYGLSFCFGLLMTRKTFFLRLSLSILALSATLQAQAPSERVACYQFTDLGSNFSPTDINERGQILLNALNKGYLLDGTTLTEISPVAEETTVLPVGINEDGSSTGIFSHESTQAISSRSWIRESDGRYSILFDPDSFISALLKLNDLGEAVGYTIKKVSHPLAHFPEYEFWSHDVIIAEKDALGEYKLRKLSSCTFEELGCFIALDINNSGTIAGTGWPSGSPYNEPPLRAVTINKDTLAVTELPGLSANPSDFAWAINSTGNIAGSAYDGVTSRPVVWQSGVLTDLGGLGGSEGVAYDINDYNVVVGYASVKDGAEGASLEDHAFISRGSGMRDLNSYLCTPFTDGRYLGEASAVNNKGQIVGTGVKADGQKFGFRLDPLAVAPTVITTRQATPRVTPTSVAITPIPIVTPSPTPTTIAAPPIPTIPKRAAVSGKVKGKKRAYATIVVKRLSGVSTKSRVGLNTDGSFSIRLDPGLYKIRSVLKGFVSVPRARKIEVKNSEILGVNFKLMPR